MLVRATRGRKHAFDERVVKSYPARSPESQAEVYQYFIGNALRMRQHREDANPAAPMRLPTPKSEYLRDPSRSLTAIEAVNDR